MKPFTEYLTRYISLEDDEKMQFEKLLNEKVYQPNEFILESNKTCKSISFLVSGSARAFFINDQGQEYTWSFHFNDKDSNFKNLFIFDYNSFLQQTPSPIAFQAIDKVAAIELHYDNLQHLLRQSQKMQMLLRMMTEQAYKATHARAFSLLTQSAKERYLRLLKEEPYLLTKFPHYFIASFLGIAPQSLSRLRKEIIKN